MNVFLTLVPLTILSLQESLLFPLQNKLYFRVQWVCVGCKKRQPIRTGSFFLKLQCSLLQSLQLILAWCEDADVTTAAQHFGN